MIYTLKLLLLIPSFIVPLIFKPNMVKLTAADVDAVAQQAYIDACLAVKAKYPK